MRYKPTLSSRFGREPLCLAYDDLSPHAGRSKQWLHHYGHSGEQATSEFGPRIANAALLMRCCEFFNTPIFDDSGRL